MDRERRETNTYSSLVLLETHHGGALAFMLCFHFYLFFPYIPLYWRDVFFGFFWVGFVFAFPLGV
jgi:hypothetical protein